MSGLVFLLSTRRLKHYFGNGMYEESTTVSSYFVANYSQLVKMISEPEE